jgi:hypothetical protein
MYDIVQEFGGIEGNGGIEGFEGIGRYIPIYIEGTGI